MGGRAQGHNDEEAAPETTSVEWLTESLRSEKPARFRWARMGWSMLPWIITAPLGKTERALPKVTPTSYLNGLRGVACVIVYNYHLMILWNPSGKRTLGAVPFVNVVIAGHGATMVFFVLSGFVLSHSPLSKISSSSSLSSSSSSASSGPLSDAVGSALLTSLWSSTIRRGFRLFMPLVALTLILSLVTFFTPVYKPSPSLPWAQVDPKTAGTFFHHLGSYAHMFSSVVDPFTWSIVQPLTLEHAWTLPFEYRGSLVVFLLCIACARLTPRCRKALLVACALLALHWVRWDVFCFTGGMFLAELRFQPLFPLSWPWPSSSSAGPKPEPLPLSPAAADADAPSRPWARLARAVSPRAAFGLLALGPAIVVCAWPDAGFEVAVQPYISLHAAFTPSDYHGIDIDFLYASVGAVAVLASLEALPSFQWLLSTTPFRYLGEISFSIYLVHLVLIVAIPPHILIFLTTTCGWSFGAAFALMWVVSAVIVVLVADLFWRSVDETSVRLSRKISNWLITRQRDTEIAYHAL